MSMMTSVDDYADTPTLTKHLAEQLTKQRLALILGAGISKPFGLPDWNGLIWNLYDAQSEPLPSSGEPTQQVEDFRLKFFKNNHKGFIDSVSEAVYKGVDVGFKELRENLTLASIASLVMASKRGSTSQIVTFNYDNLLEIYLAYHGFVAHSVSEEIHWFRDADVNIYHPHGFLPYGGGKAEPSSKLILDRESYDEILGKDLPWRQLLLTLMRTHTCLFIGLSGEDVALSQLLTDVKKIHAIVGTPELFWGVSFTTSPDLKPRWESRNVFCKVLKGYDELPDLLFKICQTAAGLRGVL